LTLILISKLTIFLSSVSLYSLRLVVLILLI